MSVGRGSELENWNAVAVAVDRVEGSQALSGADEDDLSAGLNFRQIDVGSLNNHSIRRFSRAQRQTIETTLNHADREQVRIRFWMEKSHRQSPLQA